jgi:hypothetical protein
MSMPDTSVKYFNSTMGSAPTLSGSAGALIAVLDACLVNGFGVGTLDSVAVVDDVATCTISAGHGLALIGTTGPVIRISGVAAPDTALNGDWRVATIPNSTTFTFATTGITNRTVNTVACQRAPAGFSKAFTGTNKAAYRSDDITGTRLFLRVDDTNTTNTRIRGYEDIANQTAFDNDAATGPYPTDAQVSGGLYAYKSNSVSSSSRPWTLMSDGWLFYFFADAVNNGTWNTGVVFGDIDSYKSPDAFASLLISTTLVNDSSVLRILNSATGGYFPRSYLQTGTSIASARYSHGKTSSLGSGGQTYPAPVDSGVHLWPVECWEGTALARGMLPGLWNPIHNSDTPHGTAFTSIENLPNRTVIAQTTGATAYECAIDITGPWR